MLTSRVAHPAGAHAVAIIEDYAAIAKRLRELHAPLPKSADEIAVLERSRNRAGETARVYVENRFRHPSTPLMPRRRPERT